MLGLLLVGLALVFAAKAMWAAMWICIGIFTILFILTSMD